MLWPKKNHTWNLITKKNSCGSKITHPPPITFLMVRRLRYHGDGGRKRHLKSNFTFFKLQRDYHNSLTLSNVGKLSWI